MCRYTRLVSEIDPSWEGGRVWACTHIGDVPTECNYAWVIGDWWRHHAYVHCRSAHCSLGFKYSGETQTAQRFAIPSHYNTDSLEKTISMMSFAINDSDWPGQHSNPSCSCGQLECRRVPRPFLLPRRIWFLD